MDRLRSAAALLTLLLLAAPAQAGTVAIVQPPNPTAELTETVSRLHGELISVGLEVKMITPGADRIRDPAEARPWIEQIAAEGGIDAVIDVVGDNAPIWVDVWVFEKSPKRLELWRVASEPNTPNASERLAIRAIEVLRSSFLESDMSGKARRQEPVAKPAISTRPRTELAESPPRPERIGLGLGASVLTSTDGVGPAILPVVQLNGKVRTWFGVHAEVAGLGSRSTVATTNGKASVSQQYGIFGGSYRFLSNQGLSPFLALSAGALRTSVQGEATVPNQGHDVTEWSFLLDTSVGVSLRLPGHTYLSLAGHVQWAEPYVAVHIMDAMVATSGRPNLALTLTVGAWL